MTYIGIDVSKDSFVAYPVENGYCTQNFKKSIEVLPKIDHAIIKAIDRVILSLSKQIQQLAEDLFRITKSVS